MHTALRASSITLQELISAGLAADPILGPTFDPLLGGTLVVSLNTPEEMRTSNVQGLSVWLYRVERDEQLLNAPPTRPMPTRLAPTPLPLRLHYLITPIVALDPAFPLASPSREQEILGKAMQVLYGHPVLRGVDLRDDFTGTDMRIAVRLEPMTLEEITRIWHALHRPYQLSVSYEVSLATIAPAVQPAEVAPVLMADPRVSVIVGDAP